MLLKVISGGQTGVDQAALRAAEDLGMETGGTMPKEFMTEAGPRPDFAAKYGMIEHWSSDYRMRTAKNVADSQLTIWFCPDKFPVTRDKGRDRTESCCDAQMRPFILVSDHPMYEAPWVIDADRGIKTASVINFAGPRESRCPGVNQLAYDWITEFLIQLAAVQ